MESREKILRNVMNQSRGYCSVGGMMVFSRVRAEDDPGSIRWCEATVDPDAAEFEVRLAR